MSVSALSTADSSLAPRLTYPVRVALRVPAVLFFLATAWYGLLAYVPFTYLQFLRHDLFVWLTFFVAGNRLLYWVAILLSLVSIADDLRAGWPSAWAFAA